MLKKNLANNLRRLSRYRAQGTRGDPVERTRLVSVAKPELGGKHQCQNCGVRFFDLNRSPVACPKCGTVVENLTRVVRHAMETEDEGVQAGAETELVPLEEADAEEDKVAAAAKDEVEIDADDDTFLEEEEEDTDDVGDLIGGDIGDEEER